MIEIELSKGYKAIIDEDDLELVNQYNWCLVTCGSKLYAITTTKPQILMHRLILGLSDRRILTDHIDKNGLNNRRYNLREATYSENLCNRNSFKNSSSKYRGVSWDKQYKKWLVHIRKDNKTFHVGRFENEIDAAIAYNSFAKKLHGEFANFNVIEKSTNIFSNRDKAILY